MEASVALSDLQVVFYIKGGFLALLVYDSLLQINEEYLHVWKSRWTLIKCLYLWTRYSTILWTIISFANSTECNIFTIFATAFGTSTIGVTELILMVRTYTLYERSKKLLVFFFIMWFSGAGVTFWSVTKWTSSSSGFTAPPAVESGIPPCWTPDPSHLGIQLVCYLLLLVGETFIVLLTLGKVFRKFYDNKCALLQSLYCDGVWFYLAILPFSIATVVVLLTAPPGLNVLPNTPVLVMHAVLSCRLITHTRGIAEEEDHHYSAVKRVLTEKYMLSDVVVDISPESKV